MTTAIYPGSFDPITNGHCDIIKRAIKLFDKLIIGITQNHQKTGIFTIPERIELIQQSLPENKAIEIKAFSGLLVNFAKAENAKIILRGLRNNLDFEYEMQLANMNHELVDQIETMFLPSSVSLKHVTTSLIKEIALLGGDIKQFVPKPVAHALNGKYKTRSL